jgi:hypothetical protein
MRLNEWNRFSRGVFHERLKTVSLKELRIMERLIEARMQDVERFYPWPALTESLAQDLKAIWNEQKFRSTNKT